MPLQGPAVQLQDARARAPAALPPRLPVALQRLSTHFGILSHASCATPLCVTVAQLIPVPVVTAVDNCAWRAATMHTAQAAVTATTSAWSVGVRGN